MNKKKLTLLIALSIFITYIVAPFTVVAFGIFDELKEEKTVVEKVSIKKPQGPKYIEVEKIEEVVEVVPPKSIEEIAKEVILGLWGNGEERKTRLIEAGYNYDEVQKKVNELYSKLKPSINYNYNYSGEGLTKRGGVFENPKTGLKETWYSQRVLPGKGLKIPGRHVNAEGFVCDENGYICVASSDYPKGTIIETSRGMGKVYDCGCASGILDLYVNW